MADEAKPTVASLATKLQQVADEVRIETVNARDIGAEGKEAAQLALKVTEAQAKSLETLKAEQVALAQMVNGLKREPGDAVRPGALDNVMARLEAVERAKGQDWSPMFEETSKRLGELAVAVTKVSDSVTALEDKTGVQPGGQFEDLARDVEALKARLEHGAPTTVDALVASEQRVHEIATELIGRVTRNISERLVQLEEITAVMPVLPGRAPAGHSSVPPVGVHDKVLRLMDEITSISKSKEAKGGGIRYMFRGIEEAQNAVGAAMRKVRVLLRPEVISWDHITTPVLVNDDKGTKTVLWSTSRLTMRYTFVDPADGSEFSIEMVGEGKDNSDKSASKAASMACKYALFQALMIPFEQVDESDGNHVVEENHLRRPLDTPGARVSRGEITPAQAVQEYTRPKVEQPKGGYNPAADGSAMAGADTDDTLAQKAAQAAYYLRQATQQPADVALNAIKRTMARVVDLGIGEYKVDGVLLRDLANSALQNVNAALAARTGGGAQGVTRQGQQSGDGARAAAFDQLQQELAAEQEPPGYNGSEQEYNDALAALASPNVPEDVAASAMATVHAWEATH